MLSVLTNYSSRSFFTKLTLILIFAFINSFRFLLIYLVTYDLLLGGVEEDLRASEAKQTVHHNAPGYY